MGVVYKAFDPHLGRYAAIKVMSTGGDIDDELKARFFLEARSAAKLNHPNVISIYDLIEDPEQPFIAMEYIEGEDLKDVIQNRSFVPFEEKIKLVIQICDGLDYAHRNGVVHRDIKPGNVFVMPDGTLKILDFGLARLASSEMTQSGTLMGSPYYMSPEQVKGRPDIDGRSDLFSAGIVLYEFITYRKPFEGDTATAVCFQIVTENHQSISEIFPGCASGLVKVVDRALSKDPDSRYQTGAEMSADLEGFREQIVKFQNSLRKETVALQTGMSKRQREFANPEIQDLISGMGSESEQTDSKEASISVMVFQPDQEDYGSLLEKHAKVKAQLDMLDVNKTKARQILVLFKTAKRQLKANELDACRNSLEEIFQLNPENAVALDMQEKLDGLRGEEEASLQINTALAVARSALKHQEFDRCLQVVATALEVDPEHAGALELQESALQQIHIAELLPAVRSQLEAGDYQACYDSVVEALKSDPAHPELNELRKQAAEKLGIDEEHQGHVAELLVFARNEIAKGNPKSAIRNLSFMLDLEPGNAEALSLKKKAESQVKQLEASRAAQATQVLTPDSGATQVSEATQVQTDSAASKVDSKTSVPSVPSKGKVIDFRAKGRLTQWVAGVAVVLVLAALGVWWGVSLSDADTGELILNVSPWARVDSIVQAGTANPVSIDENLSTPCVVPLPPGVYRVRVSNPHFSDSLEFEVAISAGQPSLIYEKLSDFDLESELSAAGL